MSTFINQFDQINNNLINTRSQLILPQSIGQFYGRLHASGAIRAWDQSQKIEVLEIKIVNKLRHWCEEKNSSPVAVNFNTAQDRAVLIREAKSIKLSIKLSIIAAIFFTALLSFLVPFSLIGGPISFCVTLMGSLICPIGFYIFAAHLQKSKILLEKRVNVSQNFQAFVQRYLIEKIQFVPSRLDLIDSKLHHIYREWKKDAKSLLNR